MVKKKHGGGNFCKALYIPIPELFEISYTQLKKNLHRDELIITFVFQAEADACLQRMTTCLFVYVHHGSSCDERINSICGLGQCSLELGVAEFLIKVFVFQTFKPWFWF